MTRIGTVLSAFLLAMLVAVAVGGSGPAGATDPPVVLALEHGAGGLAWSEPMPFQFSTGLESELGWDLTALHPDQHRSDLLALELADVQGPARFSISTVTPLGDPVVLLDSSTGPDATVLQLGRTGTFHWNFDGPGTYTIQLTASLATRDGVARADATYVVDVTEGAASASPLLMATEARAAVRSAAQSDGQVVVDDGHVDMGPRFVDGTWRVQIKDDTVSPHVWRDLRDVVLHARDGSRLEIPADDAYAFLGPPGSTVYVLPQVQQAGLVWPGWNTQDPSVLDAVPGSVTWRLRGIDGPGRFVLYLAGSFGAIDVLFDTADPLPQELGIGRNTHVHGNWAFTEPGIYRLTVEMAATDGDGGALSDTRVLTIAVGDDVDPATAFPPGPGGSSTTSTSAPGSGDMDVTARVPGGPSRPGGGGGAIATTGLGGLGSKVAMGAALIVAGVLVGRRRTSVSDETHSQS